MTKRKDGETMTARELIVEADRLRMAQNLSQAEWSRRAGLDESGSTVCLVYGRGSCNLETIVKLLKPLGYELKIMKVEDMP